MNKTYLYEYLNSNPISSQRKLANDLDVSVGTVNRLIKQGIIDCELKVVDISYREKKYLITAKGKKQLNITEKVKTAVILAAGVEKVFDSPRSFLKIGNETLIERNIKLLRNNGIKKIFIVVGKEYEQFGKIENKLGITLIVNDSFEPTGTLYSLSLIKQYIKKDFLLIEGDIIYEETAISRILNDNAKNSTIISDLSGGSDSVFVNIKNNNLIRVSKDKYSLGDISGELIGISRISYLFFKEMIREMKENSNPLLYYEYMLEKVSKTKKMKCLKIPDLLWAEIDNAEHYEIAKNKYLEIIGK